MQHLPQKLEVKPLSIGLNLNHQNWSELYVPDKILDLRLNEAQTKGSVFQEAPVPGEADLILASRLAKKIRGQTLRSTCGIQHQADHTLQLHGLTSTPALFSRNCTCCCSTLIGLTLSFCSDWSCRDSLH